MSASVTSITLPLPLGMGSVNCFLIRAGEHHILVDTGPPTARARLLQHLKETGWASDALNLIVLTHGDFDHIGNAAYLRRKYGTRIAMHADDAGMAEAGDMFFNRSRPNPLLRALIPRVIGFGRAERFTPDVLLADGSPLCEYGLDGRVIGVPGHSKGSIGILTTDGDFLCGDLLENIRGPRPGSIMDDSQATLDSLARVRGLPIKRIYPGHGEPFSGGQLAPR